VPFTTREKLVLVVVVVPDESPLSCKAFTCSRVLAITHGVQLVPEIYRICLSSSRFPCCSLKGVNCGNGGQ